MKSIGKLFGAGGKKPTPEPVIVEDTGPDAVERERLKNLGRMAFLAGTGPTGVLGNTNIGRSSLLTR